MLDRRQASIAANVRYSEVEGTVVIKEYVLVIPGVGISAEPFKRLYRVAAAIKDSGDGQRGRLFGKRLTSGSLQARCHPPSRPGGLFGGCRCPFLRTWQRQRFATGHGEPRRRAWRRKTVPLCNACLQPSSRRSILSGDEYISLPQVIPVIVINFACHSLATLDLTECSVPKCGVLAAVVPLFGLRLIYLPMQKRENTVSRISSTPT